MLKTHTQTEPDCYLIIQRLLFPGSQTRGVYGTPGKAHGDILLRLRDMIALEKHEKGKSGLASDVTSAEMYERFGVQPEAFAEYTGEVLKGDQVNLSADERAVCRQAGMDFREVRSVKWEGEDRSLTTLSADELSICRQLGLEPQSLRY